MFGVLIVDDEMIVRYGIKSMIDWEKIGLTVIGDAANGKEAMELFNLYKPQIVITDIKMPIMDGIELIKCIREGNPETKIIILSCLQDFAYAKEAIRLGASEYLVKSDMMPSDLENILVDVKKSITIEQEKLVKINEIRVITQKSQELEKEAFLKDIISGAIPNNEATRSVVKQLELDYLKGSIYVLDISIDYHEDFIAGFSENEKKNLSVLIFNLAQEILEEKNGYKGEVYTGKTGEVSLLVKVIKSNSEKSAYDMVNYIGEKIIKSIKEKTGYSASVGVSTPVEDLFNIRFGYREAQSACKFKLFYGCGKVIHYASTVASKTLDKQVLLNFKELQDCIYFMKRDEINRLLDGIFNRLFEAKDYEGVNLISLEMVLVLSSIYSEICKDSEDVFKKKKEYYEQIKHLETIEDIRNWFKKTFGQLIDSIETVYNCDKNIISKAINYISNNYSKEITLQNISDYVHLSKNYFVNLFKSETGESFVEYLTKIRIENAKALLKNSNLKASEVGIMVGIEDQRYFSKVFKKITGQTPTEFKELKR